MQVAEIDRLGLGELVYAILGPRGTDQMGRPQTKEKR